MRAVVYALRAALGIMLLWFGGFLWFVAHLPRPETAAENADGIVVLTGRPERLSAGFDLLREGRAKRMLISGVGHGINVRDLSYLLGGDPVLAACCVDLGHEAQDTIGNAVEIATWAKRLDYGSLFVVTSVYHTPRGLLEIGRSLPRARLQARPVVDTREPLDAWWRNAGIARLLATEYSKYLYAVFRARLGGASQ